MASSLHPNRFPAKAPGTVKPATNCCRLSWHFAKTWKRLQARGAHSH